MTAVIGTAPGTVVVGIGIAVAVPLVLGGHHEAALPAADHPGERELMPLPPGPSGAAQEFLNPLELSQGHHGLVLAGIGLALPGDDACVEGIREDAVDRGEDERS